MSDFLTFMFTIPEDVTVTQLIGIVSSCVIIGLLVGEVYKKSIKS